MGNLSKYIDSQFFIIDSNNLNNIHSELFGFSLVDGKIFYNHNLSDETKLDGEGTYIRILRKGNSVEISQDLNGCYGIFMYTYENNFVISNSFLKLTEYVVDKYPISLNTDVLLSYLPANLCAIQYKETMINEIEIIPRNYIINIDIPSKTLDFKILPLDDSTISIDSMDGIKLLDDWFYKWVSIFRSIALETNNFEVDLSGGFDSRVVLTVLLNSQINLNKIRVYSKFNPENPSEDYEIASIIANKFNFKLNAPINKKLVWVEDIEDSINLAYYIRLCNHKHFGFARAISQNPIYVTGGYCGERLKDYYLLTPQEYTKMCVERAERFSKEFKEPTQRVLEKSFSRLQTEWNIDDKNSKYLTQLLLKEAENRNHFGKMSVGFYLTNQIRLSPLCDQKLYKFKNEGDLLFALIFTRYCPELLDIKFDKKKFIKEHVKNKAKEINEKYPFELKKFDYIDGANEDLNKDHVTKKQSKVIAPEKFVEDVFKSESFINTFNTYFSPKVYQKIIEEVENASYQPLSLVNCSIAMLKMINLARVNNEILSNNPMKWLENFLEIKNFSSNS